MVTKLLLFSEINIPYGMLCLAWPSSGSTQCGDTHIVALLPPSSSLRDSTTTLALSLSYPSLSVTCLRSQL